MHPDIENMSDEKIRAEADKYMRLFAVAYAALLRIADPKNPNDKQNLAADAVALIEHYPYDDHFRCGGSALQRGLGMESGGDDGPALPS